MTIQRDPENTEGANLHGLVSFTGTNVLEVGCGNGRLTWRFADKVQRVIAIDPDAEAIATAIENRPDELEDRVEFVKSSLLDFKIPGDLAEFDVVLHSWSLCCMESEEMMGALERAQELLKSDGLLINIQPYGEAKHLEIHRGSRLWRAGRMRHRTDNAMHKEARATLEQAINKELFIVERACSFPFLSHFDTMADLEDWMSENWQNTILDSETAERARALEKEVGGQSQVIVRDKLFIVGLSANENSRHGDDVQRWAIRDEHSNPS